MSRHTLSLALLLATTLSCGTDPNQQQTTTLTGTARDYAAGGLLAGAGIALLEQPGSTATADSNGNFTLSQLTPGSSVRVIVTAINHKETTNAITFLSALNLNVPVFGAKVVFVGSQYAVVGLTPTAGAAMVIAELEDDLGTPRTGIPLADITLVDQSQAAAGTGPYIFGANGNLDNTLTVTAAFGGRSRIAFLNVPPGNYTLRVIDGGTQLIRPLEARTDGVTLVVR